MTVVRTAGAQHAEVPVPVGRRPVHQLLREVVRRRDRRRILPDVEAQIEVRDVGPLAAVIGLDPDVGTMVALQDVEVERGHLFAGQPFSLGAKVVDRQLELGEHRLAEESAAVILHDLAEVEELLVLRLGPLDHHVREQQLVVGRGDLGGEDRIGGKLERLRGIGQQRVHRMTPFVRVGGQPVIFVAEVEQQIGVNVIGRAVHVGARRLTRPRKRIHPAFGGHFRELADIVGSERPHCLDGQLAHLGEAVGPVGLHQRRVDVPIAHVRETEHPATKFEIPVQHREAAVGLRDERTIHRLGHVAAVERSLERAVIVARLGREQGALHLRGQRRAKRTLERLVARPELVEDHLAVGSAHRRAGDRIALVIEPNFLAVAELHRRTRDIG